MRLSRQLFEISRPVKIGVTNGHSVPLNGANLSIYLPVRLNPRGGQQTGSGEPSAGG